MSGEWMVGQLFALFAKGQLSAQFSAVRKQRMSLALLGMTILESNSPIPSEMQCWMFFRDTAA
jgi:hypothetical protein